MRRRERREAQQPLDERTTRNGGWQTLQVIDEMDQRT